MSRLRCVTVAGGATVVLAAAISGLTSGIPADPADPAGAVTRICTVALLLALAWAWVTVLAGVVDAWRHAATGRDLTTARTTGPRRLVLALCGVACTGALLTPVAQAATPVPTTVPTAVPTTVPTARVQPAVTASATPADARHPHPSPPPAHVVVRRGDCLWSIAASQVQPGAGPMTVTARWRALYAANRGVIGADPDLITPGQRLRTPR